MFNLDVRRQTLFGTVFVSVGSNVLNTRLNKGLAGIPGINHELLKDTGATDVLGTIAEQYRPSALQAYNHALRVVFQVGLCMACLAVPGALAMEWRTVKKKAPPKNADGAQVAEKGNAPGNPGSQEASAVKTDEAASKETTVNSTDDEKNPGRDKPMA